MCVFFVIIIIKITIITIIIIITTIIIMNGTFCLSYAQNVDLTSGKKMTKLPALGGGGLAKKENVLPLLMSSLIKAQKSHIIEGKVI